MAKIQKIELNLSQKIANPFKTTRKSTTNPFKYQDFEGNTLDVSAFADVFSGSNGNVSKLKMISSSVIGSITKLRTNTYESIVNFVNRVKDGITGAWSYAKNTNIEIAGLKKISNGLSGIKNSISDSISGIGKSISGRMPSYLNKDITDVGHDLASTWNILIEKVSLGKIGGDRISSDMPVARLKELWIQQNELANMEVKVA